MVKIWYRLGKKTVVKSSENDYFFHLKSQSHSCFVSIWTQNPSTVSNCPRKPTPFLSLASSKTNISPGLPNYVILSLGIGAKLNDRRVMSCAWGRLLGKENWFLICVPFQNHWSRRDQWAFSGFFWGSPPSHCMQYAVVRAVEQMSNKKRTQNTQPEVQQTPLRPALTLRRSMNNGSERWRFLLFHLDLVDFFQAWIWTARMSCWYLGSIDYFTPI